jgi:aminoglycoside 3-N-acetyltransferase
MIGAPLDTISMLHHAEHLAQIPEKRIRRMKVPLPIDGRPHWRMIEEFDTVDPVGDGLATDYFKTIVELLLATKGGSQGLIGDAASVLLPAAALVAFAVGWIVQRY